MASLPYGCNARFHNGQWLAVRPKQDLIVDENEDDDDNSYVDADDDDDDEYEKLS